MASGNPVMFCGSSSEHLRFSADFGAADKADFCN